MTSDGDDSDSSAHAPTSFAQQPAVKRNVTTYSLFSILFMISFALFGTHKTAYNSAGTDRQLATWDKTVALPSSLDSNKFLSDGLWSSKSFGLSHSHHSSQSHPLSSSYWSDGGSATEDFDHVRSTGPIVIDTLKLSSKTKNIVDSSSSTALWVYQDRYLQLYPKDIVAPSSSASPQGASSPASPSSKSSNKYLRTTKDDTTSAVVNIIPQPWDHNVADAKSGTHSSLPSASINRILMTSGAALLDPSLYINRPHVTIVNNQQASSGSSSLNDRISDTQSRELSSWTSSSTKLNDMRSQKKSLVVNTVDNMSDVNKDHMAQDNVLVILLPASSIRWGGSWSESKDRDINWILNQTYAGSGSEEFEGGENSGNPDPNLWLEVICTISRANLVRNVTLTNTF